MLKQRLKTISLTLGLFALSGALAQASDVLVIRSNVDRSVKLETIRRITFNNGKLVLKTSGSETEVSLSSIKQLSFGSENSSAISQPQADDSDLSVSLMPGGNAVVKTSRSVLWLTVYDLSGQALLRSTETQVNLGNLPQGIYLMQIGTNEGIVTKKIIKH